MRSGCCRRPITLLVPLALLAWGCAASADGSDPTAAQDDAQARAPWGALARKFARAPHLQAGSTGTTANPSGIDAGSPPQGDAGPSPNGGAPAGSDAVIAGARTPDGQAIPQPAGPNGDCAPVVALLGFWSCPTLGETCSYPTGSVTHLCSCSRVDGEGQSPAWVCN